VVSVLTAAILLMGVWLTVQKFLPEPPGAEMILWIGGAVVAPVTAILIGYTNGSFTVGALIGGLPLISLSFGGFLRNLTLRGFESAVAAAFYVATVMIPLGGALYVLGVALRRDGTLTRRKRGLAKRMAAAVVVGLVLGAMVHFGVVEMLSDQ
jgi:hypothetical protein